MAYNIRAIFDTSRDLAFGAIGAAFAAVGAAVASPPRIIKLKNFTDATIEFSFDGVNVHSTLLPNGGEVLDITANKVRDDGFFIAEGTVIYVRQQVGAPTAGNVHVEIIRA